MFLTYQILYLQIAHLTAHLRAEESFKAPRLPRVHNLGEIAAETISSQAPTSDRSPLLFGGTRRASGLTSHFTAQRKFQGKWQSKLEAFDVALSHRFPRTPSQATLPGTALGKPDPPAIELGGG